MPGDAARLTTPATHHTPKRSHREATNRSSARVLSCAVFATFIENPLANISDSTTSDPRGGGWRSSIAATLAWLAARSSQAMSNWTAMTRIASPALSPCTQGEGRGDGSSLPVSRVSNPCFSRHGLKAVIRKPMHPLPSPLPEYSSIARLCRHGDGERSGQVQMIQQDLGRDPQPHAAQAADVVRQCPEAERQVRQVPQALLHPRPRAAVGAQVRGRLVTAFQFP